MKGTCRAWTSWSSPISTVVIQRSFSGDQHLNASDVTLCCRSMKGRHSLQKLRLFSAGIELPTPICRTLQKNLSCCACSNGLAQLLQHLMMPKPCGQSKCRKGTSVVVVVVFFFL
mmetsp:Transcript_51974/g.110455  ORF Transcript_51974/g.110455 Transcript_51974/m.110455 type:complete len:115 (+) Transcript_51974:260-604(+)